MCPFGIVLQHGPSALEDATGLVKLIVPKMQDCLVTTVPSTKSNKKMQSSIIITITRKQEKKTTRIRADACQTSVT